MANEGSYNYTVTPLDWRGDPSFVPVTDIYKDIDSVGKPLGDWMSGESKKRILYAGLGALVTVLILKWFGP